MDKQAEENPFAQLFSSSEDLKKAEELARTQRLKYVSDVLTRIFLFTNTTDEIEAGQTDREWPVAHMIRLPQLSVDEQIDGGSGFLCEKNIAKGLTERLQLTSLISHCSNHRSPLSHGLYSKEMAVEGSLLEYLAHSYLRATKEMSKSGGVAGDELMEVIQMSKRLIGEMAGTLALAQRRSRELVTLDELLLQTLLGKTDLPLEFFTLVANCTTDNQSLHSLFNVVLERVFNDHKATTSLSAETRSLYIDLILFFTSTSCLAKLLTASHHWLPSLGPVANGKSYESTLLGKCLCPSSLALSFHTPSEHFPINTRLNPSEINFVTSDLYSRLTAHMDQVEKIVSSLLRVDDKVRRLVIKWLVDCFEANSSRSTMAYRYQSGFQPMLLASDGCFLNINWVLLQLCKPLMVDGGIKERSRLSLVDPSYCTAWSQGVCSCGDAIGPLVNFNKETRLVPTGNSQPSKDVHDKPDFKFVTHCFFLTQKSLILGMTQVVHKLEDLQKKLARAQEAVRQTELDYSNYTHPIVNRALLLQSQVLGLQAHAMHPDFLRLTLSFHASTAQWLVNLVTTPTSTEHSSSQPQYVQSKVQILPECLVDNMANFTMFLRHSDDEILDLYPDLHSYFITCCTIFMGSSQLVHNPHTRAKLAQLINLIAGIGSQQERRGLLPSLFESQREVFANHRFASEHLLQALMSIFIDIEFTGESMEFEDKFHYRLPMYALLEFLWPIPTYRPCIEILSHEAVESLAHLETPIFLRFINMIVNDATVQLDEGLENLAKVKQIDDLMASVQWAELSDQEKEDTKVKLAEARMFARYRNLLAQKTISALGLITEDTPKPFVVESIVQRMANMLNYVLNLLVGPKSRQFKVKNVDELNFKPDELVSGVIKVYLNLGKEISFCEALVRDGRSFSMDLFAQARRVITVLNRPSANCSVIAELTKLEERVKILHVQLAEQQNAFENSHITLRSDTTTCLNSSFHSKDLTVETCVVVTNSEQHYSWHEYGVNIHIPKNSLPEGVQQCSIHIKASLALGGLQLPQDTHLVSAVYSFKCYPKCQFSKHLTLEIQHCAKLEDNKELYFVRAISGSKLQVLQCGDPNIFYSHFPRHTSYGFVELDRFCKFGVGQKRGPKRLYRANIYRYGVDQRHHKFHFNIVWDTKIHNKIITDHYRNNNMKLEVFQRVEFEESQIQLDIPFPSAEGIKSTSDDSWRILSLSPPLITKVEVDSFEEGKMIPCCQLVAKCEGELTDLMHSVQLKGAKVPYNVFLICVHLTRKRSLDDQGDNGTGHKHPRTSTLEMSFTTVLRELSSEVSAKWEDVGLLLGLGAGQVDIIKTDNPSDCQKCFREMIKVWFKQQVNPPPSWSAMVEALDVLDQNSVAQYLRDKYQIL